MPATLIECKPSKRTGGVSKKGSYQVSYSFNDEFVVVFDETDPAPNILEVLGATGLPLVNGSLYQPDASTYIPYVVCTNKRITKQDSKWAYTVSCDYAGDTDEEQTAQATTTNPTSLTPVVIPFSETKMITTIQDLLGNKFVTPVGEWYPDAPQIPIAMACIRVIRYVASYDETVLEYWREKVSDDTWRGRDAGEWCITDVQGTAVTVGAFTVGQLTFEIKADPTEYGGQKIGWQDARMRIGSYYLDGGAVKSFANDDGAIRDWGLLNSTGGKLTGTDPEYDIYTIREERDFSLILPP